MKKKSIKIGKLWIEFTKSPAGQCLLAIVPEGPAYSLFEAGFKIGWRTKKVPPRKRKQ
jgi:hypothetical protein